MVFLVLRRVSSSSELKSSLLSMCIDALESTTNSRSSGFFFFFEEGAGITDASVGECLSNPMLLCGRIVLVAKFPEVSCPQILAHTDCVLEVHTLESLLAMVPFFPDFSVGPRATGECDGVM